MCFLLSIACAADAQDRPFATFDLASDAVLNDPHDVEIGLDGNLVEYRGIEAGLR